jgi:hypothetical protein
MVTRLFIVHGMGVSDPAWANPIETLLDEIYGKYETLASLPRKERFTVHAIRYDDILSGLVAKWQADATAIARLSTDVTAPLADALVGWLRSAGANFAWTHAADVLLYRCFSDVREAVLVAVANQIFKVVTADLNKSQEARWGVLGHSLGSAVAHDALHALWTTEFPCGIRFDPADVKADFVMMVGNLSRLLETDVDVLKSAVQPGRSSSPTRGCLNFLTARHALDPFTIPRMFDPQDWPDRETVEQGRYRSIRVTHFRNRNVHALVHYLIHPAVHIPLLRLAANHKTIITEVTEQAALQAFTAFGDVPRDLAVRELEQLELIQPSRADDWTTLREIWDAFFAE